MRKLIAAMHTSPDGLVAGQNSYMDWIFVDDKMFDFVGKLTEDADTTLNLRVT